MSLIMTTHSAPEQLLPAISQNHYTPQDMTLPPLRPVGLQNGLHDGLIIPDPLPPSPYPVHYPVLPPHTLDSSGSNHSSGVHQTSPHQHSSQYSPHFPQYSQTPQSHLHSELDAPPNTPIATQFPSVYPDIGSSTSSDEAGEYLRKQLGIAPGLPVDLWSLPDPPPGQRPSYTLPVLVKLAIYGSENKRLTLQGIYDAIAERFEYYRKQKKNAWKHSIRHNLSLNKVFRRAYRAVVDTDAKGDRGGFWVLDFSEGEGYKRDRRRTRKSKQQSTTSGIRGRRRRTPDESESESEQDRDNLEIKVPSPQQKRYSFRPYRYAQRRHPRLRRSQFSPSPPAQNDYNAQSSSIPNSSDAQPHDPFQLQYPPSEAETSYGPAPSSQYTTANFSTVQSVPTNFANPSPRPAVDNISPLPLNFTYIPVSSIRNDINASPPLPVPSRHLNGAYHAMNSTQTNRVLNHSPSSLSSQEYESPCWYHPSGQQHQHHRYEQAVQPTHNFSSAQQGRCQDSRYPHQSHQVQPPHQSVSPIEERSAGEGELFQSVASTLSRGENVPRINDASQRGEYSNLPGTISKLLSSPQTPHLQKMPQLQILGSS